MKKLIGTLVAAMLAAAVFAEVNVGMGLSRGIWAPFLYTEETISMAEGVTWGGANARVGASLSASSENMGVNFDITGEDMGCGDTAYIWAKPWEPLKVVIGRYHDNTLRGDISFGSYDWIRGWANAWTGDDFTFYRLGKTVNDKGDQLNGAALILTPVDGLFIAAGFDIPDFTVAMGDVGIQAQIGYTIADIMAIKAQFMRDKDDAGNAVNAAIDLLMIEGSKISVGAIIPFADSGDIQINASYHGGFDTVNLNVFAGVNLANAVKSDIELQFGVGVGFDFGNGLGLSIDVRPTIVLASDVATTLGAGIYLDKGLASGSIGFGVASQFGINTGKDVGETLTIGVPIRMQCFF